MKQTIQLWDKDIPLYMEGADTPNTMDLYLLDAKDALPAVLVFPGGGYGMRAEHEGEPVAQFYNCRGYHAMVVNYRVFPYRYPCALLDAQQAIRLVRVHAKEWHIDPNRIFTAGFSAGGHLAASTAVMDAIPFDGMGDAPVSCKPNGAILCYPMISAYPQDGEETRRCAEEHLMTDTAGPDVVSVQNYITPDTPPCFLWHTSDDETVPLRHSLLFAGRLSKNGVPCELHVFPHGRHGLGLATEYPDVSTWADLSADWISRNF